MVNSLATSRIPFPGKSSTKEGLVSRMSPELVSLILNSDQSKQTPDRSTSISPDSRRISIMSRAFSDLKGRLSIPYVTRAGVVNLKFRSIEADSGPKYLNLSGFETNLYHVESFFRSERKA